MENLDAHARCQNGFHYRLAYTSHFSYDIISLDEAFVQQSQI